MSKQLGLFGKPAVEVPKLRLGRPRKQGDEEPVAPDTALCPVPYQVQRRNSIKELRAKTEELREKIDSKLSEEPESKPLEDSQNKPEDIVKLPAKVPENIGRCKGLGGRPKLSEDEIVVRFPRIVQHTRKRREELSLGQKVSIAELVLKVEKEGSFPDVRSLLEALL